MGLTRTFVFITQIPDFLLEPIITNNNTNTNSNITHTRSNRDPRFERLRAFLATHTSGVMLVMHLETRGFALALYASEPEALAACKTNIIPIQNGVQHSPLILKILQRERPPPSQAVYTPHITIEGEVIEKSTLADTRGLELVYRGRAVPKWCPNTRNKEDCIFGTSCNYIHKKLYQQTVRRRPRVELTNIGNMTKEEETLVHHITSSTHVAEEVIIPAELKLDYSRFVSITKDEALTLVGENNNNKIISNIVKRVEEICTGLSGPYFIKFAFPGGSPWDWSLYNKNEGISKLRQFVPFPVNGAPTPLERDLFSQKLFYYINQMNRFTNIKDAILALTHSPRVREALQHYLQEESNNIKDENEISIKLCIRPWLFLPTVGVEATVLLEESGEKIRGIIQRYSALRLMTSLNFLQKYQMDFTRYAVLESEEDVEAEVCLENELKSVTQVIKSSIEILRKKLRNNVNQHKIPATAAWCVQLAVILPPSLWKETNNNNEEEENNNNNNNNNRIERCVVLSLQPYQHALEEFATMYGDGSNIGAEIQWNTKRHPYIPLFSRELMERLKCGE